MSEAGTDRIDMLVLLSRLANELSGSTDARSWSVHVGLASGLTIEPARIDLDHVPTVIIEERRNRSVVYTTLGDVVHIQLAKGGVPRLESALAAGREATADAIAET
jgi:hypothetical protein